MYLELIRTVFNDKKDAWEEEPIFINPFNVVAVEIDRYDAKCSLLVMVGGKEYYIKHRPRFLQKKIDEFVKDNVLQKIYSQMKDQSN